MKTISGSILCSKPITLSKAASSMNNFLSIETGASIAVSSYLLRCAAAFNELVQVQHKELKGGRSERKHKHKKSRLETFENVLNASAKENHEENNLAIAVTDLGEEQSVRYSDDSGLGSIDEEGRTMERKKKKKMKKSNQIDEIERESGGHDGIEVEEEIKEKKRKKPEIKDECFDNSEDQHRMKKKKKNT